MAKKVGNPDVDWEILSTCVVNLCVGTGIILVFKALRGLTVYDVRRRLHHSKDMNTIPEKRINGKPVSRQLFYFGKWPLSMEDELMQVIGLDGVVAVRFSWLCFMFCAVYSVVAVLLCVWYRYNPEQPENMTNMTNTSEQASWMRSFQISNSRELGTAEFAAVASWAMSALVIVLIELEYRQFILLRRSYFRGKFKLRCEAETHWKAHFQRTVIVKNLNLQDREFTHREVRRRMERIFHERGAEAAAVEEVVLCSDTSKLRAAVDLHDSLAEDKKALDLAGEHGFCLALGHVAFQFGPRRLVNRIPLLVRLGIMKKPTKKRIREARAAVRDEYNQLVGKVGTDAGPGLAPLPSHVVDAGSDSETSARTEPTPTAKEDKNPTLENAARFFSSWEQIREAVTSTFRRGKRENYAFVTFRTRFTQALSVQMVLESMVAARAPFPSDIVWPNMTFSDKRTLLRQFPTIVAMILGAVVLSVLCAAIQAWANVETFHNELKKLLPWICKYIDPIRLENQRVTAINGQLASLALIGVLFVVPPLVRSFLMWYDGFKFKSKIMRTSVKVCFMYSLVALYASTFTGGYLVEDAGETVNRAASALDGANVASDPLAEVAQIFGLSEGIKSPLAMVQAILGLAALGMDSVSPYFMEFIITKLGVRLALYLLRPYVLVPWCAHKALGWCVTRRRRRGRDSSRTAVGSRQPDQGLLRESSSSSSGPEEDEGGAADEAEWQSRAHERPTGEAVERQILRESPYYDWLLVDLVVVLALCFMYGVMAPLIILPSMVFFWVYGSMIHFNFLFIYTQEFDTGGEFFFDLVDMTFAALVMSQLLLQTYIFNDSKEKGGAHPYMLPLLTLIVIYAWHMVHRTHEPECRALPLEQCKREDRHRRRESQWAPAAPRREGAPAYMDPLVLRAQNIASRGDRKLEWSCSSFHLHDPGEGEEADSDDGDSSSSFED